MDLQNDFWSASAASTAPDLPRRVSELLRYARSEGLAVVHVRASFRPDGSDWMARYRLRGSIPCIEGTGGVDVLPCAAEIPGEPVVVKHCFDGFLDTELDDVLARLGARNLLIAGLVTSTCVLFTAASAMQRGYRVSVLSDCCSDERAAHESTLRGYRFVFDALDSDQIGRHRGAWEAELDRMHSTP